MSALTTAAERPAVSEPDIERPVVWNPFTRIVFRFVFLYFGLFCLLYPQITIVVTGWFSRWLGFDEAVWQVRLLQPLLNQVSRHLFGVPAELYHNGNGDQTIFWVLVFCILVVAVAGTLVWTLLDRRRTQYRRLAGWFLLLIRLGLAGQMLTYGVVKLIPNQMPEPGLATLLTRFGDLSPFSVLWNQVGVSQPYEMLLGTAELLAAVLLFIPRTALLGAMLTVVSTAQVFVLNMTFGVPLKLVSGHLLLLSMVLLAPEARRLLDVLLLGRVAGPSTAPYPFHTRRSRRIATVMQVALGIWIAVATVYTGWQIWQANGPDRPKPPLYGIWTVSDFTRDGQALPPLLTDQIRWQRLVVDDPGVLTYQRMDGTLVSMPATITAGTHRIELSGAADLGPGQLTGSLTFRQPTSDTAVLTGVLDGHPVTVTLDRVDPGSFPVHSTGFHWIQDVPTG
jgi:hypothetical protein